MRDNASGHHLVGHFAPRPVADRTFGWRLAGKCDHLAGLRYRDLRWATRSWNIAEALMNVAVVQGHCLQANPPHPPTAHGVCFHSQFSANLCVVLALGRGQDHAPSQRDLLGSAVPTHQFSQPSLLSLIQFHWCWFRATHLLFFSRFGYPLLLHEDLSTCVLVQVGRDLWAIEESYSS